MIKGQPEEGRLPAVALARRTRASLSLIYGLLVGLFFTSTSFISHPRPRLSGHSAKRLALPAGRRGTGTGGDNSTGRSLCRPATR